MFLYEKSLFSRGIVHSYFYLENDVTKRSKTTNITPVCTERQSQRCNNSAMRLVILLYLITMELLQNRIGTHFQATPLFSMRTVSLASSQKNMAALTLTLGVNGSLNSLQQCIKSTYTDENTFFSQLECSEFITEIFSSLFCLLQFFFIFPVLLLLLLNHTILC